MKTRGSSASTLAWASRMASRYVMLIGKGGMRNAECGRKNLVAKPRRFQIGNWQLAIGNLYSFHKSFAQMPRRKRAPILGVWIGRRLALGCRDCHFDFLNRIRNPFGKLMRARPFFLKNGFLRHAQAVASE